LRLLGPSKTHQEESVVGVHMLSRNASSGF
jgi:hypothetical protein